MTTEYPYQKIVTFIHEAIACGDYAPGSRIPSHRELCETFGVSRAPVLKALDALIHEGALVAVQGSGVFVADKRDEGKSEDGGEIALLLHTANDFFQPFITSCAQTLSACGHSLRVYVTEYHEDRERRALDALANDSGVRGVLISPEPNPLKMTSFYAPMLSFYPKPLIAINRRAGEADADYIEYDYTQGGQLLGEHLLKLGKRRALFYGADPRRLSWRPRLDGLPDPRREGRGVEVAEVWPVGLGPLRARQLSAMLKSSQMDVIVAGDDRFAAHIYNMLMALGARVPEDVGLAGFDDRECAQYMTPPLTTVAPPKAEAGRLAAEHILAKARDPQHRVRLSLPCKLEVRGSCATDEVTIEAYPFERVEEEIAARLG